MTAAEIRADFRISDADAQRCEDWLHRQFEIIALHHPEWWARDCAQIKKNIVGTLGEMVRDVWRMPEVAR